MSSNNKNRVPILSFFSGGGFLDMGFEMAGFSIIWTNENDPLFAKMHAYGITSWRKARGNGVKAEIFNTKSIEDISTDEILDEAFPEGVPDNFGIIGGPPCQDFSSAGNNNGFNGERGHLTKVFFDYILDLNPQFFLFENVKNLWNNNNHRKQLSVILNKVRNKYFIDHKILNSIDYGVPQDRNRLFIIGLRKPEKQRSDFLESEFKFPWPLDRKYNNSLNKYSWPDTNKFGTKIKKPAEIPGELTLINIVLKRKDETSVSNGNEYFLPYSKKFWQIEEGNTHMRSFKRLHRYRYSPTACYGNNEVHLHPFLPRRLSVREALRIQSVDDTYLIPTDISLEAKFKMIGNGVPVKLSYAVAKSIMKYLEKNGYLH
jgi:DNA (cytosine-5)-methyltransferase 1